MKTVHLFDVTGDSLSENYELGEEEFESMPRIGEKLIYAYKNVNMLYEVIEIIHSYIPGVADECVYLKQIDKYEDFIKKPLNK